jgi:hypothetical protein
MVCVFSLPLNAALASRPGDASLGDQPFRMAATRKGARSRGAGWPGTLQAAAVLGWGEWAVPLRLGRPVCTGGGCGCGERGSCRRRRRRSGRRPGCSWRRRGGERGCGACGGGVGGDRGAAGGSGRGGADFAGGLRAAGPAGFAGGGAGGRPGSVLAGAAGGGAGEPDARAASGGAENLPGDGGLGYPSQVTLPGVSVHFLQVLMTVPITQRPSMHWSTTFITVGLRHLVGPPSPHRVKFGLF